MKLRILATVPAFALGLLMAAAYPSGGAAAQEATADERPAQLAQAEGRQGADACMRCHDEPPATLILHSQHAVKGDSRTPFANRECQTCHGDSLEHMERPAEGQERAAPDIAFGQRSPTPAAVQNEVCLGCHKGGMRMNWAMSEHKVNDVTCGTCHNAHAVKDKILVKASQPDVCFTCHNEQRAQSFRRSHHSIREGKVVCADCHNPHGSFGPTQLAKNTVNETCYQCHAEKRGPFLWEHAPVVDDCTNCHTPHGSTQPRMLKVRTPMLCQQCHSETRHPSTLYSGAQLPGGSDFGSGTSRLVAKGCLNCHPKIHGSNHPAGPRFTR